MSLQIACEQTKRPMYWSQAGKVLLHMFHTSTAPVLDDVLQSVFQCFNGCFFFKTTDVKLLFAVKVNGFVCKDPKLTAANDFLFPGLHRVRPPTSAVGSTVTLVNVNLLPGLNTQGISIARIDYAPYGQNPPHSHPLAAELLIVLEGSLFAGFVTSNPDNRLISKLLRKGDVFVFPVGLIHFQLNMGNTSAVAFAALTSQNPGVVTIANATFGSTPKIPAHILATAFQVDKKIVDLIQSNF
ncbi:putative germin-like protein 2-1 [Aristolochia californica]|uniref:putative germin-like protein 2-1 n=1 Tax=Aristolochia californica TaxID=171875 RepID=UPI0035DFFA25